MAVGKRVEILSFRLKHDYSRSNNGIEVPIGLRLDPGRWVRLWAKIDTGASFCIFQREYAEELGIDVERGEPQRIATATGSSFDAYGHMLKMTCFDDEWEFDATVYFAAPRGFSRNVLGRSGWLREFRLAIIDHDAIMHVSHYNE